MQEWQLLPIEDGWNRIENMLSFVEISRKWKEARIETKIFSINEDPENKIVSVSADLCDFCTAVKNELGSVRYVFTDQEFSKRFDSAVESVLTKMKDTTNKYATQIPPDLI